MGLEISELYWQKRRMTPFEQVHTYFRCQPIKHKPHEHGSAALHENIGLTPFTKLRNFDH